jgi:GNAT superfamily N-acetyltransferase
VDRKHAHLRAYLKAVAGLPGGELREEDGVVWVTTGIGWPMFNGALAVPDSASYDGAGVAVADLAQVGAPWFLWTLPDTPPAVIEAAAAAGATEFDNEATWMEAAVADLDEPSLPPGVTIEEATDEAGLRRWAATVREIYGFPVQGEQAWVEPAERCGWSGLPWRQWVAFLDGEPVGATMLFCGGGVAGLFGVGTKESARGRGIGRLMTLLPLKQANEPIAGFFSTEEGEPLYRSLGFEPDGWVTRWLGGMPAP